MEGGLLLVPMFSGACKEESPGQLSSTWKEACSLLSMHPKLSASLIHPKLLMAQAESVMHSRFDLGVKAFADFLKGSEGFDSAQVGAMQANFKNLYGTPGSDVTVDKMESFSTAPRVGAEAFSSLAKFEIGELGDRKETIIDRGNFVQPSSLLASTKRNCLLAWCKWVKWTLYNQMDPVNSCSKVSVVKWYLQHIITFTGMSWRLSNP